MGKRTLGSSTRRSLCAVLAALLLILGGSPVRAARPLLDSGKWDNYFTLFARDAAVPWKRISLRLDTYSGAAVDFAAYEVDPADVLVAGANARPRAIDTSRRRPVVRWRFTPPPGLTFESNDVEVPLQNREGFFVVEARRGDAVQQVWLNLSRIGLVTKESPGGSLLYAADLGSGRALAAMRVSYLVNAAFAYDRTDAHGISHIPPHARFALAEWGRSRAFVSLLPQSAPPAAIVALRTDRGVVRAGETVHVIGFARRRSGNVYRPASGDVDVALVVRGRSLATVKAALDRSGAFATDLEIPSDAPAGDVAVLATGAGASGGATLRVDGVGDTALTLAASCSSQCPADGAIPLTVTARRAGAVAPNTAVRVRVVRTPHILPADGADEGTPWGTTEILDITVRTDIAGLAHAAIPAPTDGLASTYSVFASAGAATASTSLVAPNARLALAVLPRATTLDVSDPAIVEVRGFDALDGTPAANQSVHVRIAHGPTQQDQTVTLDATGRAEVTFRDVALGMNLVSADATVNGRTALDVAAVTVAPIALAGGASKSGAGVRVATDRARYRPSERVQATASANGAVGDVLFTLESSRGVTPIVTATSGGAGGATFNVPETIGATTVGVAFVRDGAIVTGSTTLTVDGPGHVRALTLSPDRASYAPGSSAKIAIEDGSDRSESTFAVRVSDRRVGSGGSYDDIAGVLGVAGTTTQNLASADPPWHAWVTPARSKAGDVFGFDKPRQLAAPDTPTTAGARVLSYSVDRSANDSFEVTVPRDPGRYVLAIVKITEDGDVGAASIGLTVQ
jgi:hypothetical protein